MTVACVLQFQYQTTNTICEKSKEVWYYGIYFLLCQFTSCFQNIYYGKNTAIIRWPPRKVTSMQIVRTSFLGPRPLFFPPPPAPVVKIPILRANDLIKDGWRRRVRNLRSNQRKFPASKFVFVALFCRRRIFSLGRHCFGTKERNTIGKLYPCFVY